MRNVHWAALVAIVSTAVVGVVHAASLKLPEAPAPAAASPPLTPQHMRLLHDAGIVAAEHARWRGH